MIMWREFMPEQQTNQDIASSKLRYLIFATAIFTFLLIVIGIVVRVTESGSMCPDWPTCYGAWTPPERTNMLIPYVHRAIAFVSGILLMASTVWSVWRFRNLNLITRPLIGALIVLGVQIIVGREIVRLDSTPILAAIHLGLALLVQAFLLIAVVSAFSKLHTRLHLSYRSSFARLSLATLVATFAVLVSGAYVAVSGAATACSGWPLCNGMVIPTDMLGWINFGHRLISGLAATLIVWLVIQAWRTQRSQTGILVSTTAAGVLMVAQVLMGAFETAQGYPIYLLGLHIATAVAVWATLIVQSVLTGIANRTTAEELEDACAANRPGIIKDFLLLTKPIVVVLLLVTTFAGMVVGAESWPSLSLIFWTMLGGFLAAGGSGAINQYIDRHDDIKMQRTSKRPLPAGRLSPAEGLAFGVGIALASFYIMVVFVNFLAAMLTLAGIIYYVLLYSIILKKTTVQNIVIGGGAGAIPPLVGWAAATGSLNIPSLFLFAVIFMWTPPHFWALALVRRNDYARAGVPMMPVVRGERETRWQIFLYTIELVALTMVLPLFGLGGSIYLIAAAVLGGALLYSAFKVWRGTGNKVAWKMYRHSSMYLAFLFLALMVDALI
jgi:protoheme IX farnesyltransferase